MSDGLHLSIVTPSAKLVDIEGRALHDVGDAGDDAVEQPEEHAVRRGERWAVALDAGAHAAEGLGIGEAHRY